jgi:hypothetical protein
MGLTLHRGFESLPLRLLGLTVYSPVVRRGHKPARRAAVLSAARRTKGTNALVGAAAPRYPLTPERP